MNQFWATLEDGLQIMKTTFQMGGDNSNKCCFGTEPKLLRESGDFSGNRDTWNFFRETRDNSGTLQKKILAFMSGILEISGRVTQKFGRMIQISGTNYVKTQQCSNSVCQSCHPPYFSVYHISDIGENSSRKAFELLLENMMKL